MKISKKKNDKIFLNYKIILKKIDSKANKIKKLRHKNKIKKLRHKNKIKKLRHKNKIKKNNF